jgi:hypothetical protein
MRVLGRETRQFVTISGKTWRFLQEFLKKAHLFGRHAFSNSVLVFFDHEQAIIA